MTEETAIVKREVALTQRPKKRRWKHVNFMLAVKITPPKGNIPGARAEYTVVGRALGERTDDGQCFFVEMNIPFLATPTYRWQEEARRRLDTFLDPQCTCE